MDIALLLLFFAALYSIIGYASKSMFQSWCSIFNRGWIFADAAGIVLAVFWPLAWPAVILVGVANIIRSGATHIAWSFRVLYEHFTQAGRGGK